MSAYTSVNQISTTWSKIKIIDQFLYIGQYFKALIHLL